MKKKVHFLTVGIFLSVIFGFTILFLLLPDRAFSEMENRSLRTLPTLTGSRLMSGAYASDINDYFADQFPMRDLLVSWKADAELVLGKGENDGILLGKNGQLAKRFFDMACADGTCASSMDAPDIAHLRGAANGILRAEHALEQKGIPFCALLTGRTVDVCASAFDYPNDYSDRMLNTLHESLRASDSYLNMVEQMRVRYDNGEAVYYKTDHHWTTLGAYYAYIDVMRALGMEKDILPKEAFARQTVSNSFYGTFFSASGMRFVKPDTVEIWTRGNEADFTVVADGKCLEGFYEWKHLKNKDHYSIFLDGVHDVVTIQKDTVEQRPK